VDGTAHFIAAERRNHALDLTPVAEARDIALVAAALGPHGGLEARIIAEALNELGGIGKSDAAMDEGAVHGSTHSRTTLERLRTSIVNAALTTIGLAFAHLLCHWRAMPSSTRAGGCFLTLCILAGFPLGLALHNPMKGILIGTGAGTLLAVVTWLVDRQRRR
jgi:hypothetical protein